MKIDKDTIYMIRVYAATATIVFSALAFLGIYYPLPFLNIQFGPLIAKLFAGFSIKYTFLLFLAVTGLTLIFGRIYCSTLCPLGILQEIFTYLSRKKVALKNHPHKYFIAALVFGFLIGGSALFFKYIDPFTIFGTIFSFSVSGSIFSIRTIGLLAAIAIFALVIFKKRFFCTNICPVGAILGLISKFSLLKIKIDTDKCASCGICENVCPSGCISVKEKSVDNETCIKCLRCMDQCKKDAIGYKTEKPEFKPKRRDFIISASVFALFSAAAIAGMKFVKVTGKKIKEIILPAGSVNTNRMENKCLNCNLCVENCPTKILEKANNEFGAVHINYNGGSFGEKYCDYDCKKCGDVCPSGAIKRMKLERKQRTRIAMAVLNSEKCTTCRLCIQRCPTFAIHQDENMKVVIDSDKCIGCGQCKAFCRFDAVEIYPVKEQIVLAKLEDENK